MVIILDTVADKLAALNRMREEALDKMVIYSLDECSDEQWLEITKNAWMLSPVHNGQAHGVAWFDNINGKTAQSHFCTYRSHFNDGVDGGTEIIKWLEDKLDVQMLTGITPKPYRQSHQMMRHWGFNKVMDMPQACYLAKYNKHVDGVLYARKT